MNTSTNTRRIAPLFGLAALILGAAHSASAQTTSIAPGVLEYGSENQEGTGPYAAGFDPKSGAVLSGLAPGQVTMGSQSSGHTEFFPDAPAGDFAGTDTIHVGSTFAGQAHDGYSYQYISNPGHVVKGPDTFALNYASLLPAGQTVQTLTLGIEADDFQFAKYGQSFTAFINGVESPGFEKVLNTPVLTDPSSQFFSFGVDPALLSSNDILNLSIDEGGDGGDGYAVDFLTVGVTTNAGPAAVPEASTTISFGLLLLLGLGGVAVARKRRAVEAAS